MRDPLRAGTFAALPPLLVLALGFLGPRFGFDAVWILAGGVGLVFLTVGFSISAARRSARIIRDLRLAADRMGRGQLTPQVAARGVGELVLLARDFNALARRLESSGDSPASSEARELMEVLEDVLELSHAETTELSVAEIRSSLHRALGRGASQDESSMVFPRSEIRTGD